MISAGRVTMSRCAPAAERLVLARYLRKLIVARNAFPGLLMDGCPDQGRSAVARSARLWHVDDESRSRLSSAACAAGGGNAAQVAAAADAREASAGWDAVVLVEGISDQFALETLASRRGRDLVSEGVGIVAMGGATNLGHFLDLFGPHGRDIRLAGLCDAAAERGFRRGLQRAGLGPLTGRSGLAQAGFFVCVADLEDELIRSLGAASVEQVVEDQGELGSFRRFQKQPAQRGRTREAQLRRFMGTRSGRKARYARLLAGALDLTSVPRPLDRVLSYVT